MRNELEPVSGMNISTLILLAQLHRHAATTPAPPPEPVVETAEDAGARASGSGREPSWISEPIQPPAPPPVEHAPWWVYAIGIGVILSPFGLLLRKKKPDPNTVSQRFASMPSIPPPVEAPPTKLLPRTPEECRTLYLEGLESLVRRQVWPEKVICREIKDAPVETRWRAWLGSEGSSWDASIVRANGRTQGQALKGLLRSYKAHGGAWTAHALERSEKAVSR